MRGHFVLLAQVDRLLQRLRVDREVVGLVLQLKHRKVGGGLVQLQLGGIDQLLGNPHLGRHLLHTDRLLGEFRLGVSQVLLERVELILLQRLERRHRLLHLGDDRLAAPCLWLGHLELGVLLLVGPLLGGGGEVLVALRLGLHRVLQRRHLLRQLGHFLFDGQELPRPLSQRVRARVLELKRQQRDVDLVDLWLRRRVEPLRVLHHLQLVPVLVDELNLARRLVRLVDRKLAPLHVCFDRDGLEGGRELLGRCLPSVVDLLEELELRLRPLDHRRRDAPLLSLCDALSQRIDQLGVSMDLRVVAQRLTLRRNRQQRALSQDAM
mmetsp:Transcript_55281/g.123572  ORF Transcript_55281/g.123572 Transcript_55281/m.123572 type:complete len:323 (-) Transcript_55281:1226-2194(-)